MNSQSIFLDIRLQWYQDIPRLFWFLLIFRLLRFIRCYKELLSLIRRLPSFSKLLFCNFSDLSLWFYISFNVLLNNVFKIGDLLFTLNRRSYRSFADLLSLRLYNFDSLLLSRTLITLLFIYWLLKLYKSFPASYKLRTRHNFRVNIVCLCDRPRRT